MGNSQCNTTHHTQIFTLGNDAGLLLDPSLGEAYSGFLSLNSSAHLSAHYRDVQHSLNPEQLSTFDSSLRSALGDSGKVTMGGVGMVALALAMLIDILSQQAKNQNGTTNFIQKIFRDEEVGGVSEVGTLIGNYLKLVPRIANDDQRMKEETKRYEERLNITLTSQMKRFIDLQNATFKEWTTILHGSIFQFHMMAHRVRLGELDEMYLTLFEKMNREEPTYMKKMIDELIENLRAGSPELQELIDKCKNDFLFELTFIVQYMKHMKAMLEDMKSSESLLKQHDDFLYSVK